MFLTIAGAVCVGILLAYFIIKAKREDWGIIRLIFIHLLYYGLLLCLVAGVIFGIWYSLKHGVPERISDIITTIDGVIPDWFTILFVLSWPVIILTILLISNIKEKGGLKKRLEFLKNKREIKRQEKKKLKKQKKDWRVIMLVILLIFTPGIIVVMAYILSKYGLI